MHDPEILLDVSKLEVVYHRVAIAVQGVSLRVPRGHIVALLGTNGAGKTTTLRAISGFLGADDAHVTDGTVTYLGEPIQGRPPYEVARRGLVLVPEREKVFETLTVEENLQASARRPARSSRLDSALARGTNGRRAVIGADVVYQYFPVLAQRRRQIAGYLSGGERQMLAIGAALLCQPTILLVDELSLGLAPLVVQHLMELLQRLRGELGITILLVEQNVAAALDVADYGYIMENGRVVYDGTPARLLAHEDVQEFYLGMGRGETRSYREVRQYRRRRRWFG
jgi:branched-chain amino acid transport system ATP-binding protein